ncbi:TAT-variant-translocated molybdopterin oxidoreductase [Singulisphaera sp. PoT]|uniref:TAT-variant-translocated molybdopterin oxidoreductase n=1 Tax=Singulisphaera sp. PoT TaxID=3411797 RepID=UPI003BF5D1C7
MTTIHSRKTDGLDLSALRDRLAGQNGTRYWRSLEDLADTDEFRAFVAREFPTGADEWHDLASRRTFLKLMGASIALAGVSGCTHRPAEKIVPYVKLPEQLVPGKPLYYATAITRGSEAVGVLAESHTGRPTMVEGNEKHPDSLGGIDTFTQASMLTLYDPDRSQVVLKRDGMISTWDKFLTEAISTLDARRATKGKGVRILTETVNSPSLSRQLQAFLEDFPEAKWHQYEPANRDGVRAGAKLAFGQDVSTRYHVEKADVILSIDADFCSTGPGHLRYAREFGNRRETLEAMNRLYVVEPTPSVTGTAADHRLPLADHSLPAFAALVAKEVGVKLSGASEETLPGPAAEWAKVVARDLGKNRGKSLVIAGEHQPATVHALVHAINKALGNVGTTVTYSDSVESRPVDQLASLRELVHDMEVGAVDVLFIVGGNPAYNTPVDLAFGEKLAKVAFSVHLGLYHDETAALCLWHLPGTHELEAWGDVLASDGSATIQQPLIAPLYDGHSAIELVAGVLRNTTRSGYEIVRETWTPKAGGKDFETFWRTAVHDGVVAGSALPAKEVTLKDDLAVPPAPKVPQGEELEIIFRPDLTIGDGRVSNNGWLQELPKPLTKLTWDNVALISPKMAERLKVATADLIVLDYRGRKVEAPAWIMPGQAEGTITVFLGYGRTRAGRVGTGVGYNAYKLRTSEAPWSDTGLTLKKVGRVYELATTESHRYVETRALANVEPSKAAEERELIRVATIAEYRKNPNFATEHKEEENPKPSNSLFTEIQGSTNRIDRERENKAEEDHDHPHPHPHVESTAPKQASKDETGDPGYAWGMAINLNVCLGCSACVVACQAENNIPIVGKEQVSVGREMQWIDIDRYYYGGLDNPQTYHQPRTCMHCENAPCEVVCPVAATVHDAEGINNMVYNRCVGTRYCGNNCPYKVRHFNFFNYTKGTAPSLEILNNPDVTVRARGVMEKCTYCIQRINAARYPAEIEGRKIRDGEIVTACQAACPTRAISFGDINDPNSKVSRAKADPRSYGLLTELNTHPRTTYLARLRNPNPELETERKDGV